MDHHRIATMIGDLSDLLRGPYRPPQYARVILPMTVLRRFDCVLKPTKPMVLHAYEQYHDRLHGEALDAVLNRAAGQRFHNRSPLDFATLTRNPNHVDTHLVSYIQGFSSHVRTIFERFAFAAEIERLQQYQLLYLIVSRFGAVDLHPDTVDTIQMGLIFEDLIRRFNEAASQTAGDHFTPREVIQLMVNILFASDDALLSEPGKMFKLLDPACGTGGMLSEAQTQLRARHPDATFAVYGQDFNPHSYAIAASDVLMRRNPNHDIRFGDSLINDQFVGETFEYFLANPPFGVDWKAQHKRIQDEHKHGFNGRFGAGVPRVNDGALLFLQHMVSKFAPIQPEQHQHGSRLAIVLNGSPLFTGGAGSGESAIRTWIIENDWLETIIALPEQMFYNTGITTYVWIVTNRKEAHRRGTIQLIDARARWQPMRRSLGDKRRAMGQDDIDTVVREYGNCVETATSKIFLNTAFGYTRVPIERPLRLVYQMDVERKSRFLDAFPHLLDDVQAIDRQLGRAPRPDWSQFNTVLTALLQQRSSRWKRTERQQFRDVFTDIDAQANSVIAKTRPTTHDPDARVWGWFPHEDSDTEVLYEPDAQLRDFEHIPLHYGAGSDPQHATDVDDHAVVVQYFQQEVQPHVDDAWADRDKLRVGYEINFNRYFYEFKPHRPLAEIDADLAAVEANVLRLLGELS